MKEEPLSPDEIKLFSRRELIFRSIITVPFLAVVWRLWSLQIKNGTYYSELSKGNRIRLISLPAPRGLIYDRRGVILAKNIPSFTLVLVPEDTQNVPIPIMLKKISRTLKIPFKNLAESFNANKKEATFNQIQLFKDLSLRQVALIESYEEEFPGVSIMVSQRRYYPYMKTGAHILGYMNQITKSQLDNLPKNKRESARVIGQKGIESVYNHQLIGADGGRQTEVDNTGREIKRFSSKTVEPIPGNDIYLSIDIRLQKKVEEIMGERTGSAIVMNPHNGEMLAIASLPAFDPNEFSQGFSVDRWEELKNNPSHILNDKCIQGLYSPGSTFKMAVAAAALDSGLVNAETKRLCEGHIKLKRTLMHCWKRTGHGYVNVVQALEYSCNVFFYKIALEMGIEKIKEYALKFGLGQLTNIDMLDEKRGLIPDKKWKLKRFGKEWQTGETANVAIGQGFLTTTPLQILNYVNVIANGGYLPRPKAAQKIIFHHAQKFDKPRSSASYKQISATRKKVDVKPETLAILRQGMERNVMSDEGTGGSAKSNIVSIAGKTGTAQVVSIRTREKMKREKGEFEKKYYDHAWFAAYAPIKKPEVSAIVMIEHGKSGKNAAALVKKIMDYYFTQILSISSRHSG